MQMAHGKDEEGQSVVSAFHTSSFRLGIGERGETVLTLIVGESGVISFILPADMPAQLFDALGRAHVRH